MEEKRAQKKADASSSSDVEGGYHGGGSQRRKSGIVAKKVSSSRVSFSYMNDEQGDELENKSLPERKKICKVKIAVNTASGSTRILLSSKSSIFVDLVEYGEESDNEECASKSATVTDDGNHGVTVVVPSSQDFPSFDGQNEDEIDTSATPGIILKRKSSTPMIDSSITKKGKPAQNSNPAETASVPLFRKRKRGSIQYYRCQKCPQIIFCVENLKEHAKLHDGNGPSIIACKICNLPIPSEELEEH
ncbi:unnamed protein product [Orchesella dallaii]|uniref:C2H2-type domain-containing protein n=1 Tax=Orchesella dallaii TaxID=48710 RepID=A0ABP1PXM8_9HEXA